jgi:hypothetical protein
MNEALIYLISMYVVVMSYIQLKKNVQEILLDITEIILLPVGVTYRLGKIIYEKIRKR